MPLNDCNPHFQTYGNWRTEIYNIVKIGKGIKKKLNEKNHTLFEAEENRSLNL